MRPLFAVFLCSTLSSLGCCQPSEITAALGTSDKPLEWRWSNAKATLTYSTTQHLPDYDVERVTPKEYYSPINIRTKQGNAVVYSYEAASEATVFARWNDALFVAEYSPIASGCEVVAVDLKTGKELWRTKLKGLGPICHSKYRNSVNIESDGDRIMVTGNESSGRYIEHLHRQTGRSIAHKKLEADFKSLHGAP